MNVSVTIIGAGVSGLKAANTLLKHSESPFKPEDVVVLEAQDRVGGRIYTDRTQSKIGYSYDLGAAWLHDSLTNPVLHEALRDDDKDLFDYRKDCYYDDKAPLFFASEVDGPIDTKGLRLNKVLDDLHKFIELYFVDSLNTPDMSLKDVVSKFFDHHGLMVSVEQKDLATRTMTYLESWFGIPWDKVSGKYSMMDHQGRDLLNTKGYDFIIEKLRRGIPHERILLNSQVVEIDRNNKDNGKRARVTLESGEVIYSDYVIVTVPQSILQLDQTHPYGIAWKPPLPARVKDALDSIHFGALGKVIFEFEQVWWNESEDRFAILPDGKPTPQGPLTALPEPFSYFTVALNYSASHKSKTGSTGGSLGILTQSPLTEYLEANKEQAWEYFKPILAKVAANGKTPTDPINVITSDWTKIPYIRGSYSSLYVDDDPSDLIIQLSGEYDGCGLHEKYIRFAGEHTVSDGAGCVHGAFSTGLREADWIINDARDGSK